VTYNPTQYGDNPIGPFIQPYAYIPDQLIAGDAKVITASVQIGGGVQYQRGTVMGVSGFGTFTTSAGTAFASGNVTFAAVPTVGDTLTLNGTVISFVAQNPIGNQIVVAATGTTPAPTAAQVAGAVVALCSGSTDTNLVKFTYSAAGTVVTLTAASAGTSGNALTLATSDSAAMTLSGATLSGGVNNTGNATVTSVTAGSKLISGTYTAVCTASTTATVYNPLGEQIGVLTFGTAFKNPELNITITAGGTACVAGDTFYLLATPGSGLYVMATALATDGSENPTAILADFVDATGGTVTGPVYLAGEFNTNAMTFGDGITIANAAPALRIQGIYLKNAVTAADPN